MIIKLSYNSVLQELISFLEDIKKNIETNKIEDLILSYPFLSCFKK